MKKILALAMTALMAFSAQAVTIDWGDALTASAITKSDGTTVTTRYDFPTAITTDGAYSTVTKGVIKLVTTFNTTSTPVSGWPGYLFMVGETWAHNAESPKPMKGFGYYLGENSTQILNQDKNLGENTSWDAKKPTLVNGQKYEFIIAIERNGAAFGADIYLDGDKIATVTSTTGGYWHQSISVGSMLDGTELVSESNRNKVSLTDTEVYFAAGVSRSDVAAALPEPTALALLALGVAGVALKRKVK